MMRYRRSIPAGAAAGLLAFLCAAGTTRDAAADYRGSLATVRFMGYQIQDQELPGAVDAMADSRYDLLVIDQTRSIAGYEGYDSAADVARLRATPGSSANRKRVVCYVDVGEAEDYRWYWQPGWTPGNPDFIVAPDPDGWDGNYPVKFWRPEWKAIVKEYFRRVIEDGYDGAYLDWLEVYDFEPVAQAAWDEGLDPEQELISFVREIRRYALSLNPEFFLIAQNAAEMGAFPEYLAQFEAISQEAIWFDGGGDPDSGQQGGDVPVEPYWTETYLHDLQDWLDAGKTVFDVEYALDPANASLAYSLAAEHGFIPYVSMRLLNALSSTPPPGYGLFNLTSGSPSEDRNPAFSPDGDWILFTSQRSSGTDAAWIMRASGEGPVAVKAAEGHDVVTMPGRAWDPVRGVVLFSSDQDGPDDIYWIRPDGTGEVRLTEEDSSDWEPTFLRPGGPILFQSDRSGNWEIWIIDPVAGAMEQVTADPGADMQPLSDVTGDRIVFQSDRTGDWDVYLLDRRTGATVNLTNHPAEDTDPVISADGTRVIFSSDRDGEAELYLLETANPSRVTRLTYNDTYDGAPAISPDGQVLAFESTASGNLDIWTLPLRLPMRHHGRPLLHAD